MNTKRGIRGVATATALSFLAVALGQASAEPNKVQYELQERCAKAAAEAFKNDNPDGPITNTKDGQSMARYGNHYGANLNKCFVVYFINIFHTKSESNYTSTSMTLFDVNENKEYGSYLGNSNNSFPPMCFFRGKPCHSEIEWQELIKPYMED